MVYFQEFFFSMKFWVGKDTCKFEHLEKSLDLNKDDLAKYCAEEIRLAMESVNPDLKFTVELEQDFQNKKLPTLDTSIWLSQAEGSAPSIEYEFFGYNPFKISTFWNLGHYTKLCWDPWSYYVYLDGVYMHVYWVLLGTWVV